MRLALAGLVLVLIWAAMLALGGGTPPDRALLLAFHAGSEPALARAAWIVTQFGDEAVLLPLSAVAALLLIVRRERRSAVLLLAFTLSGRLLVQLQKGLAARPRPEAELHLVGTRDADGNSQSKRLSGFELAHVHPGAGYVRGKRLLQQGH